MDSLMAVVFVASGHVVNFLGVVLAILLVAFFPLYCYGFIAYQKKVSLRSSKPALFALIATIVLTILLTIVFAVTAIVLGSWG